MEKKKDHHFYKSWKIKKASNNTGGNWGHKSNSEKLSFQWPELGQVLHSHVPSSSPALDHVAWKHSRDISPSITRSFDPYSTMLLIHIIASAPAHTLSAASNSLPGTLSVPDSCTSRIPLSEHLMDSLSSRCLQQPRA